MQHILLILIVLCGGMALAEEPEGAMKCGPLTEKEKRTVSDLRRKLNSAETQLERQQARLDIVNFMDNLLKTETEIDRNYWTKLSELTLSIDDQGRATPVYRENTHLTSLAKFKTDFEGLQRTLCTSKLIPESSVPAYLRTPPTPPKPITPPPQPTITAAPTTPSTPAPIRTVSNPWDYRKVATIYNDTNGVISYQYRFCRDAGKQEQWNYNNPLQPNGKPNILETAEDSNGSEMRYIEILYKGQKWRVNCWYVPRGSPWAKASQGKQYRFQYGANGQPELNVAPE